ncbi:three-Cys-motif partner protein TcmP [Micromonospora chokoriensis]
MSNNDEFFRSKKAAAVLKHGILKRYPVVIAAKTGQGNPIVFLDGYAGRGEYGGGEPGSPLLLSRCAEFVQGFRDVLAFFVEQDPDSYANLEQVLRDKGGAVRRELRQGTLDQHLPEVLALAKGASLFAFLDPFGPALDFDVIRTRLLGRPSWPPTEVLLHFSVSTVARMGRAVHVAESRSGGLSESDRRTAERLDRFLGGSWWRSFFAEVSDAGDDQRATDVALRVAARYARDLTQGSNYQAVQMPVRPRPGLAPKYVLALFTTHGEGAWHFADTLGKAGVEWEEAWVREQIRRGDHVAETLFGDGPLFDAEQYKAENAPRWSGAIERNIVKLLEQNSTIKIVDRVPEIYGDVLGHAWAPHVRQAVKSLHRQGRISSPGTGDFWKEVLWRP